MRFFWIYVVVFLADISNGLVLSTLPLYASSLGASVALISGITSTIGGARVVSLFYLGNLSDRKGRRYVSAISLSALAGFSFIVTLLSDPLLVLVASLLNGFTITVFGTVAAYIGDHSTPEEIDKRMGLNLVSQGIGFAIGPAVGGVVAQTYGFHAGYYLASALAALALVLALRFMQGGMTGPVVKEGIFARGREAISDRVILSVCILSVLTSFAFGCIYTFFPLRGQEVGLSDAEIGTILGVRTALSAAARGPVAYLSSKLGRTRLLALTLVLPAAAGALVPLSSDFALLAVIVSLEGIGYGIFLTVSRALVAVTARTQMRGITMALLDAFGSLGQAFLVLAVGVGAGFLGIAWAFYVMSATLLLGGIGPLLLLRSSRSAAPYSVESQMGPTEP